MINNVEAALMLLKFKAEHQMCEGKETCTLNENDINEILFLAGLGKATPENLQTKEVKII